MLPGSGREAISCAHQVAGGGGGLERDANANRKGANFEVQAQVSPCQPVARVSPERTGASRKPEDFCGECSAGRRDPRTLTLGVSFLERVAGVHKAGGRVVFALELQVQLGCLAESVSGSWNREERAQP